MVKDNNRLQEEIIKYNDDHSIFAWSMKEMKFFGPLAPSPAYFCQCHFVTSGESLDVLGPCAMPNRVLLIGLRITPWAADTYLAYIDCTERVPAQKPVAPGIFLRRLTQDDQYVRINLRANGLWRRSWKTPHTQDRPKEDRKLYIRQSLNTDLEGPCLKNLRYGFRLTPSWLPPSTRIYSQNPSRDLYSAFLQPGQWGAVLVLEFPPENSKLQQAALGFDFAFNPVCLRRDSFVGDEDPDFVRDGLNLFMDCTNREEIMEGSKVYRRLDHRGIWILAGHRSRGLDVGLYDELMDMTGSILTLRRETSNLRPHYELHIDKLKDPFGKRVLED